MHPTFSPLPYPQTPVSAHEWFRRNGVCVSHWARHFGVVRQDIADLLRGKSRGNFGRSHQAAILLGLKPKKTGEPS